MPALGHYFALPPEVNSSRLSLGPGPGHLDITSSAYNGMANALDAAAAGSDGSTNELSGSWEGSSSNQAQAAFRRHASWLREQSLIAREVSALAEGGATAFRSAMGTMPPLGAILANRAHAVTLAGELAMTSSSGLGAFTAAKIAANEAAYMVMWIQAATTMTAYDAVATSLGAALGALNPPPPPPIAGGGAVLSGHGPGGAGGVPPAGGSGGKSGGPAGGGPSEGGSGGGSGSSDGGGSHGSDPSAPSTEAPSDLSPADQAISDVEHAMSSMNDSLTDPGLGDTQAGTLEQHGFSGTSPYSSTLSGLSGGMGGAMALGMLRGGLGSMSGASTSFRMPGNWSPAAGRAFGAGTGAPQLGAGNSAPRRGVSAPSSRMRRRRRDDEKKPSKVFVPGEQQDVPVLERPPEIGVIQYSEDTEDQRDDGAPEEFLVGVLDRFDSAESESAERFRRDTPDKR